MQSEKENVNLQEESNDAQDRQAHQTMRQESEIKANIIAQEGMDDNPSTSNIDEHQNMAGSRPRVKRCNLPMQSVAILKKWLYDHRYYAYPTKNDKFELSKEANLTVAQVSNWFINARWRFLPDMLRQGGDDPSRFYVSQRRKKSGLAAKGPNGSEYEPKRKIGKVIQGGRKNETHGNMVQAPASMPMFNFLSTAGPNVVTAADGNANCQNFSLITPTISKVAGATSNVTRAENVGLLPTFSQIWTSTGQVADAINLPVAGKVGPQNFPGIMPSISKTATGYTSSAELTVIRSSSSEHITYGGNSNTVALTSGIDLLADAASAITAVGVDAYPIFTSTGELAAAATNAITASGHDGLQNYRQNIAATYKGAAATNATKVSGVGVFQTVTQMCLSTGAVTPAADNVFANFTGLLPSDGEVVIPATNSNQADNVVVFQNYTEIFSSTGTVAPATYVTAANHDGIYQDFIQIIPTAELSVATNVTAVKHDDDHPDLTKTVPPISEVSTATAIRPKGTVVPLPSSSQNLVSAPVGYLDEFKNFILLAEEPMQNQRSEQEKNAKHVADD